MDRKLLKQNAKNSFKKKWFESAVVAFIMSIFAGGTTLNLNMGSDGSQVSYENSLYSFDDIFSIIPPHIISTAVTIIAISSTALAVASIFLSPIFSIGGNRYFLKLRKGLHTDIGEVTGNFRDGNYWNIVKINFFKSIKIFLWTLLFIIPGIIKSFEYYLINYILAVRPDIDSKEAFRLSKKLMDGHKLDAFVLSLSFIGWFLLSSFTFGILNIVYVNPYMYATLAEFYCFVRAESIMKGIITPMDLPDYEAPPIYDGFEANNGFGFNSQQGYQNQYQQPTQQAPFWQEANQPVGNVETMPNEEPVSEDEATEVDFKPVDEN